jgi:peptidoglycan/xylan/chitin deacetylase (PgdA/CDA1 family)
MKRLVLLLLLLHVPVHAQQKMEWPENKKAVVVLTYDDGLASQLDLAVPQLEAAGLKATFFLTGGINSETIPRWRALAGKGYELGNHTLFHPCSLTEDTSVGSASYTPERIVKEIEVMNNFLYAVDGREDRTYAYPCAETTVGNGNDYVDALRKSFLVKYARIGGDTDAVITDFNHLDLLRVPSYGVDENTPASELIAFVDRVRQSGGMGIFMFHGIGGDYINISAEAHRELLAYLRNSEKDIWVTTFREAMDYAEKIKLQVPPLP